MTDSFNTASFGVLPKNQKILWIILRAGLLCWGIYGLFHGSVVEFLEAVFAVLFTHLWDYFQILGGKSFIIEVRPEHQTMLNVFIFIGVAIGSTLNNRTSFHDFDIFTHFGAGFISAWFGYDFANIVYRKRGTLGPGMSSLFSVTFALAIAVGWEIYEFSMDRIYGMNLQCSAPDSEIGLIDTMTDFICCSAGAVIGMLLVNFNRVGIIGRHRAEVKEKRRSEKEKAALKERLYREYIKNQNNGAES